MAATQFEPTDARRAFPCWDEPDAKAVFGVSVVVPAGLVAISNAPVSSEESLPDGRCLVRFADTIRMSTYLVAVVLGRLEGSEPVLAGRTPIRVWAVPGRGHLLRFARRVAAFSVDFFERYFGIPCPCAKLDLLAIPDFATGAMENLGAITFRENALLVDEDNASHADLNRVADVVAHEVAHLWFGDLVTMKWWNGLWLNEAFATFLELKAVDAFRPDWNRWAAFGNSRAGALALDGLASTRPIEFDVQDPKDCQAMFDPITYDKGAAVLRMLEQHVGEDAFREGTRLYMNRHGYDNAETADLWAAMGEATGQPVGKVMDGWIRRPGFPLLEVERIPGGIRLSSRRFSFQAGIEGGEWRVPVRVRTLFPDRETETRVLLAGLLDVDLGGEPSSVVVNAGGHGFVRVRYRGGLRDGLEVARLLPVERMNLVGDAFAIVQAGLESLDSYLDLTARFRAESDRSVWQTITGAFGLINRQLAPDVRPAFEAFVRDRLGPALDRIGRVSKPGEDDVTRQLRADLVRVLGTLGNDPGTAESCRAGYRAWAGGSDTDPNLLPAAIAVVARHGGAAEYDDFLARYRGGGTPQLEQRFLFALAGFSDPALIDRTLALVASGEFRNQDSPFLLRSLLWSVPGRRQAWEFVKRNWDLLEAAYAESAFRRMMEGIVGLVEPDLEADVLAFVRDRAVDLGGRALAMYLEQLRIALRMREREASGVREYLLKRFP
jgi:puromycin-sensitive aminopeptidase